MTKPKAQKLETTPAARSYPLEGTETEPKIAFLVHVIGDINQTARQALALVSEQVAWRAVAALVADLDRAVFEYRQMLAPAAPRTDKDILMAGVAPIRRRGVEALRALRNNARLLDETLDAAIGWEIPIELQAMTQGYQCDVKRAVAALNDVIAEARVAA